MEQEVLTLKQEMAADYVEEFTKELPFLQKLMVWPLEQNLKEVMLHDLSNVTTFSGLEELGWFRHIVGLHESLSTSLLEFVKEKQELLAMADTREDLEQLKKGIRPGESAIEDPSSTTTSEQSSVIEETENGSSQPVPSSDPQTDQSSEAKQDTAEQSSFSHTKYVAGGILAGGTTAELAARRMTPREQLRAADEIIDVKQTKSFFINTAEKLRTQAKVSHYTPRMQKNMQKFADGFDEAARTLADGETIDALSIWKRIGSNKLSPALLDSLGLTKAALRDLRKLHQLEAVQQLDNVTFQQLKQGDNLRKFLRNNGITSIGDETVDLLKGADHVNDFKNMSRVLAQSKKLKTIARAARSGMFLDIAFLGVDIRFYANDMAHARTIANEFRRENAVTQAKFHLGVGVGSAAAGAGAVGASVLGLIGAGPAGWIVLGVGGVAAGIDVAADSLYFDVVDFYGQNMDDYTQQYRTEVKQAIVQLTYSSSDQELALNEELTQRRGGDEILGKQQLGLNDAWKALIYLDEDTEHIIRAEQKKRYYQELLATEGLPPTRKDALEQQIDDLTTTIEQQNQQVMPRVTQRMAYIRSYMEGEKKQQLLKRISQGGGVRAVSEIVAKSATYADMRATQQPDYDGYIETACTSISQYKEAYREKLRREDPAFFATLTTLATNQPTLLHEYRAGIAVYKSLVKGVSPDDEDYEQYQQILQRITYFERFMDYQQLGKPVEQQSRTIDLQQIDYISLRKFLLSGQVDALTHNKDLVSYNLRVDEMPVAKESLAESSPHLGQNIIYRVAKELHGYTGPNEMMALITFFKSNKHNALGFYYDHGWTLNRDRRPDAGAGGRMRINDRNNIDQVDDVMKTAHAIQEDFGVQVDTDGGYRATKSMIDTSTESTDHYLQQEYAQVVGKIIEQEIAKRSVESRAQTEEEILVYIQKYAQGGYIRLPVFLCKKALQAGIGDLRSLYVTYDEGRVTLLTRRDHLHRLPLFKYTEQQVMYQTLTSSREKLSSYEQQLVQQVEQARDRLEQLRSDEGWYFFQHGPNAREDELDVPIEFERMISAKAQERDRLKASLLTLEPKTAMRKLDEAYHDYAQFFTGAYLGLLKGVDDSTFSNDVDSSAMMQQALFWTTNNRITIEQDGSYQLADGLLDKKEHELLDDLLTDSSITYQGKIVSELLAGRHQEQERARMFIRALVVAMYEARRVEFDEHNRISSVSSPFSTVDRSITYKELKYAGLKTREQYALQKRIDDHLARVRKAASPTAFAGFRARQTATDEELPEIIAIEPTEQTALHSAADLQKQIEATIADVDRGGKRGEIVFNSATETLESWGHTTKLDLASQQVEGLPVDCTVEELVRFANLLNRFKHYKKTEGNSEPIYQYNGGIHANTTWSPNWAVGDTTILTATQLQQNYSFLLTADGQVAPAVVDYLNEI